MTNYHGGVYWTNHALEQLENRGISLASAINAFNHPTSQSKGKTKDTFQFVKDFGDYRITTIGTQNEQKDWVVISVWRDPPLPGTKDFQKRQRYKNYQKASALGKIGYLLLDLLGL